MFQATGNRKFILVLLYMIGSFGLAVVAVVKGQTGLDAVGLAAWPTSIATGLGTFMWGNVQEHRAKASAAIANGGSQ